MTLSSSKKRKRAFSVVYNGIATLPKSPRSTTPFLGRCLKNGEGSLLPSPPNSIQASPEPSTLEISTTLLAFVRDLRDGKTSSQCETSFSISTEEFERFEKEVNRDKGLSRYYKKKLRYEWDPMECVFTILNTDTKAEEICSRILQSLETRLRELAETRHTLDELDAWESRRVKELVDLIRPLPLKKLDVGIARMSPNLCFTFGTSDSLLGLAQRRVEPLVVFEVRRLNAMMTREDMEKRAGRYLEVSEQQCPFRHRVKTVVLIHFSKDEREIQVMMTRLRQEGGKGIVTTKVVELSCLKRSDHVVLTLSDFLPQDAIELGFMQDKTDKRACDGIKIGFNVFEQVGQATRDTAGEDIKHPKRRRVDSFGDHHG